MLSGFGLKAQSVEISVSYMDFMSRSRNSESGGMNLFFDGAYYVVIACFVRRSCVLGLLTFSNIASVTYKTVTIFC